VSSGSYKKHHGFNSRKWVVRDGKAVLLNKDGTEKLRREIDKKQK